MEKFNSSISPSAEEVDTSYVEMAGGSLSLEQEKKPVSQAEATQSPEQQTEVLKRQELERASSEKKAEELRQQLKKTSELAVNPAQDNKEAQSPSSAQEKLVVSESMSGNRRESLLKGYFKNSEDFDFAGGLIRNFDEAVDLYKDSQVSRVQKIKFAGLATSATGILGGALAPAIIGTTPSLAAILPAFLTSVVNIGGAGVASSALAIPGIGLGVGAGILGYYGFKRFKIWNDARKARRNEDLRQAFNQEKELDALL